MYSYIPQTSQPITHHHLAVCGSTNNELMQSLAEQNRLQPTLPTNGQHPNRRERSKSPYLAIPYRQYLSLVISPLSVPISGLLSLVVGFHLTRLPIIQQINRQRHAANLPAIGVKGPMILVMQRRKQLKQTALSIIALENWLVF